MRHRHGRYASAAIVATIVNLQAQRAGAQSGQGADPSPAAERGSASQLVAASDDADEDSSFRLAGFGGLGWIGLGIPSGDDARPERAVRGPDFALEMHGEVSYAFVYAGVGFNNVEFEDGDPLTQDVVNVDTGEGAEAEGSAAARMFHFEGGFAHAIPLNRYWALRPGLGFGWSTSGKVDRGISFCEDCADEVVLDEYVGGAYMRLQLGGYFRFGGGAFGLFTSYQQILGEVDEPALNRALIFGFAGAGGNGF